MQWRHCILAMVSRCQQTAGYPQKHHAWEQMGWEPRFRNMTPRAISIVQILMLICLGIILVPAGAHFFELPNKMALAPADYMITQRIYAGWAWFGLPIFLSMALLAIHAALVRNDRTAMWLSLIAVVMIAVTQTIFWSFTQPMNELTQNWTVMPADVEQARQAMGMFPCGERGHHVCRFCDGMSCGYGGPPRRELITGFARETAAASQ